MFQHCLSCVYNKREKQPGKPGKTIKTKKENGGKEL